jgi:hypothetical protein
VARVEQQAPAMRATSDASFPSSKSKRLGKGVRFSRKVLSLQSPRNQKLVKPVGRGAKIRVVFNKIELLFL